MKYFTMGELVSSATADRRGINNRCSKQQADNLRRLVDNVLDPLREAYGKPINVSSGYRCEELNKVLGGSPTSDHLIGCAADIVGTPATKEENEKLFSLVISLGITFDQLINEKDFSWVHVSYRNEGNRKQILKL